MSLNLFLMEGSDKIQMLQISNIDDKIIEKNEKEINTSTVSNKKPGMFFSPKKVYCKSQFSPMKSGQNLFFNSEIEIDSSNLIETSLKPNPDISKTSSCNNILFKESIADYEIKYLLGKGAYSIVLLVIERKTGKKYAMKIINKSIIEAEDLQSQIMKEKSIMQMLSHVNIIHLHSTFTDHFRIYFTMEYVSNRSMRTVLMQQNNLQYELVIFYAAELVKVLEYISSQNIIHRDLKPDNILIDKLGHLKVIDFGAACFYDPKSKCERRSSIVGTKNYVSPEALLGKEASPSSDLWSLGCIIYEMITGKTPFYSLNEYEVYEKILRLELNFPKNMPIEAVELISSLLRLEPDKRIGWSVKGSDFVTLKSNVFFKGIDFENLYYTIPPASPNKGCIRVTSNSSLPDYRASMSPIGKFEIKLQYFTESNQKFLDMISPSRISILFETNAFINPTWISPNEKRIILTSKPALRIYGIKKGGIFEKEMILTINCKIDKQSRTEILLYNENEKIEIKVY